MQFRRAARALYICGPAAGGWPHPHGVRAGGGGRGGAPWGRDIRPGARRSGGNIGHKHRVIGQGRAGLNGPRGRSRRRHCQHGGGCAGGQTVRGTEKITPSHLARAGPHLRPPVLDGPGAREHRVDRPPVRPRRRGRPPRVAPLPGGGDRRRPRPLGPLRRPPLGVQGPGRPGVPGRGGCHLRPGGVPPGPLVGRPVPPARAGPPHRHLGGGLRRHLRPGQLQRPAPARPERHHVRSRAPLPGRAAPGGQAGGGRARRAAFPAARRLCLRRRGRHGHRP